MQKPYTSYVQNGQNRYAIYDHNGWKNVPIGVAYLGPPPPSFPLHRDNFQPNSHCTYSVTTPLWVLEWFSYYHFIKHSFPGVQEGFDYYAPSPARIFQFQKSIPGSYYRTRMRHVLFGGIWEVGSVENEECKQWKTTVAVAFITRKTVNRLTGRKRITCIIP